MPGHFPDRVWTERHAPLSPDTAPDVVWAAQVEDVRRHLECFPGAGVEAVSEACVLPASSVRRALAELQLREAA